MIDSTNKTAIELNKNNEKMTKSMLYRPYRLARNKHNILNILCLLFRNVRNSWRMKRAESIKE